MDGVAPEVHGAGDRPHDERGDEVARDGGLGVDTEEEDQDRGEERSSPAPGDPDDQSDAETGDERVETDVHQPSLMSIRPLIHTGSTGLS